MTSFRNKRAPIQFRLRPAERRIILLIGDVFITILALLVALYFWSQKDWLTFSFEFIAERPPLWFFLMPVLWILVNVESYDLRRAGKRLDTLRSIAVATVVSFGFYLFIYFTSEPNSLPRRGVAGFIVASAILMIIWRFSYISIFTAPQFMRRVLIVGAGRAGSTLAKIFRGMWPPPFFVVGMIDDDPAKINSLVEGYQVLGGSADLSAIIEQEKITDLIFAITGQMNDEMFGSMMSAAERGIEITTMPMVYEELLGRVPIFLLQSDWILRSFLDHAQSNGFYEVIKRMLDVVGGLVGTGMLAILLPVTALAIYLDSGRPIFFSQIRVGKNGRLYKILKYRTMRNHVEKDGKLQVTVENDVRITRVGRILRKSHLDELPQFINVLRGEMSLVGPRAEINELVNDFTNQVPFYRSRLLVKPGMTGWAQVNFGYASTVEDTAIKLEHDLYYIKHRDLLLDIIIILRTFGTVVGFRGQ